MFDIGWPELLVVAIVLIIVVGPKDLPAMLRAFGRTTTKLRGMASEFRGQFDEALREANLDEVRKTINEARSLNPMNQIRDAVNPLKQAGEDIKKNLKDSVIRDKPATPADDKKSDGTAEVLAKDDKPVAIPDPGFKLASGGPTIDPPASSKAASSTPVEALKAKPAGKPAGKAASKASAKAGPKIASAKPAAKSAPKTAPKTSPKTAGTAKTAKATTTKPATPRRKPATATKAASKKGQA